MAHAYCQVLTEAAQPTVQRGVRSTRVPVSEPIWGNGLNSSLFTHPVYVRAQGYKDVVSVHVPALGDKGRALFSKSDRHLTYLDRISTLTPAEVDAIAEAAFEDHDARFIIFRDVQLRQDGSKIARPHLGFHYQANWERTLGPDETYLSSRQASGLRRKTRKLIKTLGTETDFEFRRTVASDIDVIGQLNKTKIEKRGGIYQMSSRERAILKEVAGQIGYTGTIHGGGRLIAGTVICVAGPNAYCMILGYDLEFAKFSQGLRVNNQALAELAKLGVTHANFLWGDSRWKADLGAERRPLTTFIVCRNRRTYLDPALLRSALPHAKLQLKRRIKTAITISGH